MQRRVAKLRYLHIFNSKVSDFALYFQIIEYKNFIEMENDKVTKDAMEAIRPGGRTRVFRATSVADFQSQQRMAYWVRQNCPRTDGGKYVIQCSGVGMTISVKVEKGGAE